MNSTLEALRSVAGMILQIVGFGGFWSYGSSQSWPSLVMLEWE